MGEFMNVSSFYMIVIVVAALLPSIPIILNPMAHAASWEWICALLFGFILSIPLIWTTSYELRSDQHIYATKNRSFIVVFVIIFIIRFLLRDYLKWLGYETEAALFITVAIGYIFPWRIVSFLKFRRIYAKRNYKNKESLQKNI